MNRAIPALVVTIGLWAAVAQPRAEQRSESGVTANAFTPVKWSAQATGRSGDEAEWRLKVVAVIQPGWHLFSVKSSPENNYRPTRITLLDDDVVEPAGPLQSPAASRGRLGGVDGVSEYYVGAPEFLLAFRLKDGHAPPPSIRIAVTFQACSDHLCARPATVSLGAPLTPR